MFAYCPRCAQIHFLKSTIQNGNEQVYICEKCFRNPVKTIEIEVKDGLERVGQGNS